MSLAVQMRPRALKDILGQSKMAAALAKQMAASGPQALMFSGPSGCGKTTLSRVVAVALQCPHQAEWGNPCVECWSRYSEFQIHEVNASDKTGVDEMRALADVARYSPTAGAKRVIILNEAHRLSKNAQDLLLDPTEHPPASTVWIICTTEPSKIVPTLRKRFLEYKVSPLSTKGREILVARAAKTTGYKGPVEDFIAELAGAQVNAPRDIVTAFEKLAAGLSAKEAVVGGDTSVDSLRLSRAVIGGDRKAVIAELGKGEAEESRLIKAVVAGYLRGCMARETDEVKQRKIAVAVQELAGYSPYEDSMLWVWLQATILKITIDIRRRV